LFRQVDGKERKIFGVFLHEIDPHFYVFAFVSEDLVDHEDLNLMCGYVDTTKQDHTSHFIWDVILTFLHPFAQAHSIGTVKSNEHIKFRCDGEKVFHKIRQIVHVFPKTKAARDKAEETHPGIDWTHQWAVRGHWREISGVGKNRAGEYCIAKFTWVEEHVKGPENKPFIEKTRVVVPDFFKTEKDGG
jgi:hypothetical protein